MILSMHNNTKKKRKIINVGYMHLFIFIWALNPYCISIVILCWVWDMPGIKKYEMRWGVIRPLFKIELTIGCLFVFLQLYVNIIFKAPYKKICIYDTRTTVCIKFFFLWHMQTKEMSQSKSNVEGKNNVFFSKM